MIYRTAAELLAHGIEMPCPDQVRVGVEVPLENISREGVVLQPGVRIHGPRTVLAQGVVLGEDGPVVVRDSALGPRARVRRGSADGAVLLRDAVLGPDAHVRGGTILEEEASTAHSVGLKQTILLPFATLGSQINFCDALLAGGRSRHDHSEVGSGFIHFNFTPFGACGDKATASLFGDATRGVLLRENRIFLGGAGGVVGPIRIGFGTVLAAGSVYRRDYGEDLIVYAETLPMRSQSFDPLAARGLGRRLALTEDYVRELNVLHAFYRFVRRPRERDPLALLVLDAALRNLEGAVAERLSQADRMIAGARPIKADAEAIERWPSRRESLAQHRPARDLPPQLTAALDAVPTNDHVERIQTLDPTSADALSAWLADLR